MASLVLRSNSGQEAIIDADRFLGAADSAFQIQMNRDSSGITTVNGTWNGELPSGHQIIWSQSWGKGADTGDIGISINTTSDNMTEANIFLDGNFYSMGRKVIHTGDVSGLEVHSASKLNITGFGVNGLTYIQTSGSFAGREGWTHYIVCNHGDGSSDYNCILALPFWGNPLYGRKTVGSDEEWHVFLTDENYSSYALPLGGGSLTGPLILNTTHTTGSWDEGIRINRNSSNSWATLHIGGSAGTTAGSQSGAWTIASNPSGQLVIAENSSDSSAGICLSSTSFLWKGNDVLTAANIFNYTYSKSEITDKLAAKSGYKTLAYQMQVTSYRHSVIALHETSSLNNSTGSYSSGRLTFKRPNGLYTMVSLEFTSEDSYYTDHGTCFSSIGLNTTGIRPCVFNYNGKTYGGVEVFISNAETNYVEITGLCGNFEIFALDYYSNTEGVLNAEVNSSINYDNVRFKDDSFGYVNNELIFTTKNYNDYVYSKSQIDDGITVEAIIANDITSNGWLRTGQGWYNHTYDGGMYMIDSTWIRVFNNKKFYVSNTDSDAINTAGGVSCGNVYAGNALRTTGDGGWYSEKWGGGFYMSDGTWIRAYGDKNIYTGGIINCNKYYCLENAGWGYGTSFPTAEKTGQIFFKLI